MSRPPVKSAIRALEVLSLFSRERKAMSQGEIIRKLGYPQSSGTFLLRSLMEAGYLSYDRKARTYLPTPEVMLLGRWLHDYGYEGFFSQSSITDLLGELQAATNETVSVATQNDIFVQLHRVLVRNLSETMYIPEGAMLPLTYTALGHVLLASQPKAKAERICRLINAREHGHERRLDIQVMQERLKEIREAGHSYVRNPFLLGAGSIAALLPVTIAGREVAVGIGGTAERIEARLPELTAILKATIAAHASRLQEAFESGTT